MRLGCCSRSNEVVEPMIKPQWFVSCSSMAKQALDAATDLENLRLEFFPKHYLADWKRRLEKLEDTVNAATYIEKAPSHVKEADAARLAKLLKEMNFSEEESEFPARS